MANESVAAQNHGGGYQYRLCPKSEEPTEACFQRHPLEFVGKTTTIRKSSGNKVAPDFEIPAMDVNVGTSPKGSSWRRNPIRESDDTFPRARLAAPLTRRRCRQRRATATSASKERAAAPSSGPTTRRSLTGSIRRPRRRRHSAPLACNSRPPGLRATATARSGTRRGTAGGRRTACTASSTTSACRNRRASTYWRGGARDSHTKQDYRLLVSDQRCCKVGL